MNELPENDAITYEEAKELARHEDEDVRKALAARTDVKPEILYFLADDPSPDVRRVVAANQVTPRHADLILAKDDDEDVRSGLAGKIAALAPGLAANERDKLRGMTYEAIELLARDELTRVRQILSEALKDFAGAPPEVIKKLAYDSELVVAGPVLEFSPVLTDEDLLEIIRNGPVEGGLSSIARRESLGEPLSAALAALDDDVAIADLLSNAGAQIREETLDDLISRGGAKEFWHAPLVRRPKLSPRSAAKLAHIIADNLLEILEARDDLDDKTMEAVKSVVQHRIDEGVEVKDRETSMDYLSIPPPLSVAQHLYKAGKLDQRVVSKAIQASDNSFVVAAVTVMGGLPLEVVQKILASHNPKGVVALAWKSGLSAKLAVAMQKRMARIGPREVLMPKAGKDYPLSEDEMKWQLEFFGA